MLQAQEQLGGKRLAHQIRDFWHLLVKHLHADYDMADKLSLVRVSEDTLVAEFADLSDVMEKDACQKKITIELRVNRRQAVGGLQQCDDVLEQAAQISMVVADAGGRFAESIHELGIHQKAFNQCP